MGVVFIVTQPQSQTQAEMFTEEVKEVWFTLCWDKVADFLPHCIIVMFPWKLLRKVTKWNTPLPWMILQISVDLFVWNILDNVGTQLKTLVSQQMGNLNRQTDQGGLRQEGRRWGKVQVKHSHWATSLSRQKQLQFKCSRVKEAD